MSDTTTTMGWLRTAFVPKAGISVVYMNSDEVVYAVIDIAATDNPFEREAELNYWAEQHWAFNSQSKVLAYALLGRQGGLDRCLLAQASQQSVQNALTASSQATSSDKVARVKQVLWTPPFWERALDENLHAPQETKPHMEAGFALPTLCFYPDYLAQRQQDNQRFYGLLILLLMLISLMAYASVHWLTQRATRLEQEWIQTEQTQRILSEKSQRKEQQQQLETQLIQANAKLEHNLLRLLQPLSGGEARAGSTKEANDAALKGEHGLRIDRLVFEGHAFRAQGEARSLEALGELSRLLPSAQIEMSAAAGQQGVPETLAAESTDSMSALPLSASDWSPRAYQFNVHWSP